MCWGTTLGARQRATPDRSIPGSCVRLWIQRNLFPAAPSRLGGGWKVPAGYLLLWTTSSLLLLARVPTAVTTLWAEDSNVFLLQAIERGCAAITTPYAGYMEAAPRLIACAATSRDLREAAHVFGVAAVIIGGATTLVVFRGARALLPNVYVRLALALLLVLTPLTANDVAGVTTNLQWLLFASEFWLLLWTDRWPGTIVGALVAILTTTSSALSLLLTPLAAVRVLTVRSWRDRVIPLAYLGGSLLQLAIIAGTHRAAAVATPTLGQLTTAYLSRVVTVGVLGPTLAGRALAGNSSLTLTIAALCLLLVLVLAWRDRARRPLALTAVAAGLLIFVATTYRAWSPLLGYSAESTDLIDANRYFFAPVFLLWTLIAIAAEGASSRTVPKSLPWLGAVASVMLAVGLFSLGAWTDFRLADLARHGVPSWSREVGAARSRCATSGGPVTVHTAPAGWAPAFTCGQLR